MALKFSVFATLLAIARASILPASQPLLQAVPVTRSVAPQPYDPNPQYNYGYEVQDPLTGDSHGQVESRSGDVVKGSYALLDADGTRRVVDYTADPINGFNAVVSKQPVARVVAAPVAVAPVPSVRTVAPVAVAPPQQIVRTVSSVPVAPVAVAQPQQIVRTVSSVPVGPVSVAQPQSILRTVSSVSVPVAPPQPILRAATPVVSAPWATEPVLRSAPVAAGPWASEPLVRAAPAVSAGPWAGEPVVRAAAGPWASW